MIQFPYLCIWCNPLLFRAVLKFRGISRSTLISSPEAAILLVSDGRQKGPLVTRLRVQHHKCEAWNRDCACVRLFLWRVLKSDTFYSCPKTLSRDYSLIFNPFLGVKITLPSGFEVFSTDWEAFCILDKVRWNFQRYPSKWRIQLCDRISCPVSHSFKTRQILLHTRSPSSCNCKLGRSKLGNAWSLVQKSNSTSCSSSVNGKKMVHQITKQLN